MSRINPKSTLENKQFLLEMAQKAADTPVDPAKEAALLKAIQGLGQDVTLLNERALNRVVGLDEGLKARAVIAALAIAYGPELKAEIYRSSNIAGFVANLIKTPGRWNDDDIDRTINRFVTAWRTDVPLTARDGQELDLASIANLTVQDGPMKDKLLKNVGRGEWEPVQADPHAKWAAFEGESFGVLRLDNGKWSPWFQNDWNKDQFPFEDLSSASLKAIRERLGDEPGFRGLGKQLDKILADRNPGATQTQRSVEARMAKVDLTEISAKEPLHANDIMGLPAQLRVSQLPSKSALTKLIDRFIPPVVGYKMESIHVDGWANRKLTVGEEYASIMHAGQPIIINGAHLTFTAAKDSTTYEGGLIELSNRQYRFWNLDPVRRQGSFPARNYFELTALDTKSLEGLRAAVVKLTPEGADDAVMNTARTAHGFGTSYGRLVLQIDRVLAERQAS